MLQPNHDYVLIRQIARPGQTKTGLYIPTSEDDMGPIVGDVLAVGPGKTDENGEYLRPIVTQVGQRVVFKLRSFIPIDHDGEELLLGRDDDVIAVVLEEPAADDAA